MEPKADGGAAFPVEGMSLRDYIAAQVLNGFIAYGFGGGPNDAEYVTNKSYALADAMLKARRQEA